MSPIRRATPWVLFGPFLLMGIAFAVFGSSDEDRTLGLLVSLCFLTVVGSLHLVISHARLELSNAGVSLRQIGMNLTAAWPDIAAIHLEKGREGFVVHSAIDGAGATRLAAVRGFGLYGSPMYNDAQRAAMAERRWIPIEPFAWHLKHGTLATEIERFAPGLLSAPAAAASQRPPPPLPRSRWLLIGVVLGLSIGAGIVIAQGPPAWERHFIAIASSVVAPLFTVRAVWSARNAFRAPSRLLGVLFSLLALVCAFWTLGAWIDLGELIKP